MVARIKQIQSELVRFRRQFVMKHLNRKLCRLEPTETEKKPGLMLFRVPPDEAFTAGGLRAPSVNEVFHLPLSSRGGRGRLFPLQTIQDRRIGRAGNRLGVRQQPRRQAFLPR